MQGFHAGLRLKGVDALLHGRANLRHVGCSVPGWHETLLLQALQRPVMQANAAQAVVVLAGGEIETPDMAVEQVLAQPQRVAHGHEHDAGLQAPFVLKALQPLEQVMRNQRAGQLVRVQAGLDVDLALRLLRAKAERRNHGLGAGRGVAQGVGAFFHAACIMVRTGVRNQ